MTFDSKGQFPKQDRMMLELNSKSDWIPPDPAALVLPYIEKDSPEEESDIDKRLKKTQQVIDGYSKIVEQCKTIREEINQKCAGVKVTINSTNEEVLLAASRFFKRKVTEITFDMYKEAVHAMAAETNNNVPNIGG
jgi:hypothetical protein